MLDRAAGDAERDAGDGKGEQADRRKLVQGPGIEFAAAIGAALDPLGGEGAIGRHKHIGNFDILAAGGGEADHLPGVDDRVVTRRHQEHARLALPGLLIADDGAEHVPGRGIYSARKRPTAAEAIAALDAPRPAARKNQCRADQAVWRFAPDFLLRLGVPHAEQPMMGRKVGEHPGGRAATAADHRGQFE